MLTSPAAHTWACLCFPTMLTSRLSATDNDALYHLNSSALYALCGYTRAHCVTGRDRLLVLVPLWCLAFSWFDTMSSRVDWNRST